LKSGLLRRRFKYHRDRHGL